MGVFSKTHRFREAGEAPNVNNVARFGEPVRSLFTTSKLFSLHNRISITDDKENVVYQANSKVISLRDKTTITDAAGNEVAHIQRKIWSLHERHFVTMSNGRTFEVASEIFHLVKDIINLPGLDWQLRGNILGLNFELYDRNDAIVAVIGQKLISLHDKYCVDIYQPQYEAEVVAFLITLQHMMQDRNASAAAASSSSSSS